MNNIFSINDGRKNRSIKDYKEKIYAMDKLELLEHIGVLEEQIDEQGLTATLVEKGLIFYMRLVQVAETEEFRVACLKHIENFKKYSVK